MGNPASRVRWGHYTNFNGMQEGQSYPKNLGATAGLILYNLVGEYAGRPD